MVKRPRRLRVNDGMRALVRETRLTAENLIYPLFVVEGKGVVNEISSMPGVYHFSIDTLLIELDEVIQLGIPAILLFGVTNKKDLSGSECYNPDGLIQRAIKAVKERHPELLVAADVCLCEYTSHGHCGVIKDNKILNDETVELLVKSAISYARAGADIIAPSDMMDGRVKAIRNGMDKHGYTDVAIMSYSAKYASSFYSPFREAAQSAPSFGDRKTYQMDYCNKKEAIREVELDIEEGADIIMVKPALSYLDIINEIDHHFYIPIAAYHVSGEYAMIKAAVEKGWLDEKKAVMECVISMKRAGADIIITYYSKDIARWLREEAYGLKELR